MILSHMANYSPRLAPVFHALADPTRGAVVARLATGPASVGELAEPFAMALPTFLQHLKVLEAAGLVRSEKHGRVRMVRIEPSALAEAEDWLARRRREWEAKLDRLQAFVEALETETKEKEAEDGHHP